MKAPIPMSVLTAPKRIVVTPPGLRARTIMLRPQDNDPSNSVLAVPAGSVMHLDHGMEQLEIVNPTGQTLYVSHSMLLRGY